MAFKILTSTPSAAVASSGTTTFTLGNAAEWGQVKYEGGHTLYAEGLQAQFTHPTDFTLSTSGATITLTYLGTTPLPAGKNLVLQLEVVGENNYLFDAANVQVKDYLGNIRVAPARPFRVMFGNPAAGSATAIRAAAALAVTTLQTLTTAYVCDVPRAVTIKSSGADTAVITIRGYDEFGVAMTESLTLNGTNAVNGKKAFKTVVSYQAGTAPANNLSIGTTNILGFPVFVPGGASAGAGYLLREIADGALATAGTTAGGVISAATATTGDVRGTYTPNTTPDGSVTFEVVAMFSDVTFKGVSQYAG